ncbi:glycoside hydrolase family 88 protein [Gaetbulibacter sp. M240]|uniref:glycoside hydrolase family 88 protein n=1 Tax=Gaetbulibacter sp. M240 TaxID=3126511 RepID=UPI00374EB590
MKFNFKIYGLITSLILMFYFPLRVNSQNLDSAFTHAEAQTKLILKEIRNSKEKLPIITGDLPLILPRTLEHGELKLVSSSDWTSGFFPGVLWYLYEYSNDKKWLKVAKKFTTEIEREKFNATTHDMGFKINCSFGNGFRLTNNKEYKDVIVQSAKTLIGRFNPQVGAIRSWDFSSEEHEWDFPVIIDNMMNLELLFEATKITGDSIYHQIAVHHANTTLKNHFRDDNSSFHVVDYDPVSGNSQNKNTFQGYSDDSAWARGQAWGLYGFTLCYRYTKDEIYLKQAEKIAQFIFSNNNLPNDLIPYWDFDAPNVPNEPRDVSAATVIASALYELSKYSENKEVFVTYANTILKNISRNYKTKIGDSYGFILLNSTGFKPFDSEVEVPIIYADYYYLEALMRLNGLNKIK